MGVEADIRAAVTAAPGRTLLALDFDGTLSPIVDDPEQAFALPAAIDALEELAPSLGTVAIVTGRPPLQAVELAGLEAHPGLADVVVLGHYGGQRWAHGDLSGQVDTGRLADVRAALPAALTALGAEDARIEDKGLAVAVHTRGLPPDVFARLLAPLTDLAAEHGLHVEPGRQVIELRPPGSDKGDALRALIDEVDPHVVIFVGDDLGDLPAFAAVRAFAGTGFAVCAASAEQPGLASRADVVLSGPVGVAAFLAQLARDLH